MKILQVLKIKKLKENAVVPTRATDGAAGYDLSACIEKDVVLHPGCTALIPTGIGIQLCGNNCAAFIFARSGLAVKHGIALANGVGVVDSDYRGEICVGLQNRSKESFTVKPGMRIAQMVIMPVVLPLVEESTELEDTQRGKGGFGSTGC